MSFGLKNAPHVFQRKIKHLSNFTCVYVDDILVFSKTKYEHLSHLHTVFKIIENEGLVISRKKMHLFKTYIEFLGVELGNGKIKLQLHIARKILEYPDDLKDLKQLQSFLGLLNYARRFIKNLSKFTRPLYNKTSIKGTRQFNTEDIKLVKLLKQMVQDLPEMAIPLETDYLVIQTDGCETGRGEILLKKPLKYSSSSTEQVCRYASGKYKEKGNLTSLDYELLAVIYTFEAFALFLVGKE